MSRISTRFKRSAISAVLAAAAAAPSFAAESGSPFTVATGFSTTNGVGVVAVARGKSGDFVVEYAADGGTYARVYNADGTPKGEAFRIGGTDPSATVAIAINPEGTGDFVAAWNQSTASSPNGEVFVQRYSQDGIAQGTAIDVGPAPYVYANSTVPTLAIDDDGDFAVAWTTVTDKGFIPIPGTYTTVFATESSKTYAAVYKADGSVIKRATVIDNVPPKIISPPLYSIKNPIYYNCDILQGITLDSTRGITAFYAVGRRASLQTSVGRYTSSLRKQGALSVLSDVTTSASVHGRGVAMAGLTFTGFGVDANGNFAAEWIDWTDSSLRIHVSFYAADGSFLGNIVPIETPTNNYDGFSHPYQNPKLSMAPSGDFVVTWGIASQVDVFGDGGINDSFSKHGQYFHADGTANGDAFEIYSNPDDLIYSDMATAVDAGNNLVSVWSTLDSSGNVSVVGNLTAAP